MNNDGIFSLKEFINRGVIKLAPDALVYIGGSLKTQVVVPVINKEFDYSSGITSITVNNTMENPGASTAAIEIVTPIYGPNSAYWVEYPVDVRQTAYTSGAVNRVPLFIPMMEIKIFFKGRFLVDGEPKYYLAFWGLISHVEEHYTGGVYKISLSCVDVLHWWAYSTLNVHPSVDSNVVAGGYQKLTAYSTIFDQSNPFQVISTLNTYMGMSQFVTPAWVAQMTPMNEIYPAGTFSPAVLNQINIYWNSRFASSSNLLKMYGLQGERVNSNGLEIILPGEKSLNPNYDSENAEAMKRLGPIQSLDTKLLREFTLFFDFSKIRLSQKSTDYLKSITFLTYLPFVISSRC